MTVPQNWDFPLHADKILSGDKAAQQAQWGEFIFSLRRMYEDLAFGINGTIRNDALPGSYDWTPVLNGATTSGTFTYTSQYGYVLRQGLLVDVWFDVIWSSAGSAAGNLYLELPYEVALGSGKPFVGVMQPSSVTYTAGTDLVINAIPNTRRGEFWYKASATATGNQAVVGSGQLIGHIRYIGKADE